MHAGRLIVVILGALLTTLGFGAAAGGSGLALAHATQRDSDGYYRTATEPLETSGAALVGEFELTGAATEADWFPDNPAGTIRIEARSPDGEPLFVGIAPAASARAWLAGAAYERIIQMGFGPLDTTTELVSGTRTLARPDAQTFWVASTAGPGQRDLTWASQPGEWAIVVANVDGHSGVAADVAAGVRTGVLLPMGVGLGAIGLLLLVAGVVIMLVALGRTRSLTCLMRSDARACSR
jgi:hypothetical protein